MSPNFSNIGGLAGNRSDPPTGPQEPERGAEGGSHLPRSEQTDLAPAPRKATGLVSKSDWPAVVQPAATQL